MRRPTIAVTYSSGELDEFTLWRHMFEGIVEAGATPLAVDASTRLPGIEALISRVDGLIIGGGGDVDPRLYDGDPDDPTVRGVNPDRDDNELRAWRTAREQGMPVLAICRGAQLLNVDLGGELYVDLRRDHGTAVPHRRTEEELISPAHEVTLKAGSRLAEWHGGESRIAVNSQHHQGIKRIAPGTVETARSDDGLAEAYELTEANLVAVQWHPEVLWKTDPLQRRLLQGYVDAARTYATASQPPSH